MAAHANHNKERMVFYENESCTEGSRILTLQSKILEDHKQMTNQITIREAVTNQDTALFWEQLHAYHKRDIFPEPGDEDRDYFLDDTQYRAAVEKLRDRAQDRCYYLFFCRNEKEIGFAMPVIYHTEDSKCFLMEFCVFPAFRGNGTGSRCAEAFLAWACKRGAAYTELNCDTAQRRRFWQRTGFLPNGRDEWGIPLMLLPPKEPYPITVEILTDPKDWQLRKLENGYLAEIGEEMLTKEKQAALSRAIADGKITFFLARRGCRSVGMCSVVTAFSTFACTDVGTFEDFYVEPVFRKQGIARKLTAAARQWCREKGVASLSVTCAPCDEELYQALGFDLPLGSTRTAITNE